MNIFERLESTEIAEWVASSIYGYPIMLGAHVIGLSVVVGIIFMMNLRIMGCFSGISFGSLNEFSKLTWTGFTLNFVSGFCLFMSQATFFITNVFFLVKISVIFLAVINAAFLQNALKTSAETWDSENTASSKGRKMAISSLILWSAAIISGRLIAYV